MRADTLFQAKDEDYWEFQPLGRVQGDQGYGVGLALLQTVHVLHECGCFEEGL